MLVQCLADFGDDVIVETAGDVRPENLGAAPPAIAFTSIRLLRM
jgi:hypothetical protein